MDSVEQAISHAQRQSDRRLQARLRLLGTAQERDGLEIDNPVKEEPALGNTEIWSFANWSGMSHPIHLHLVHFQMLGRQSIGDDDPDEGEIDLDALEPYERGWNDVVTVDPVKSST